MFNRLVHPKFLFRMLSQKEFLECCWYYEKHPFGHDIDHTMIARMIAAMAGKTEADYMPTFEEENDLNEMSETELVSMFPGLGEWR